MADHFDRQLKIRGRLECVIYEIWDKGEDRSLVHSQILEMRNRCFYGDPDYSKLTVYNRMYLDGVWVTVFRFYHRLKMEQGYYLGDRFVVAGKGTMSGEDARAISEAKCPCITRWRHSGKLFSPDDRDMEKNYENRD